MTEKPCLGHHERALKLTGKVYPVDRRQSPVPRSLRVRSHPTPGADWAVNDRFQNPIRSASAWMKIPRPSHY